MFILIFLHYKEDFSIVHLQKKRVLFFHSSMDAFPFLVLLHWQCWIEIASRHVPDLRRKGCSLSPLNIILAIGFGRCSLRLRKSILFLVCWDYQKLMMNFGKCFICIYWDNLWWAYLCLKFLFSFLNMRIIIFDFQILNLLCITCITHLVIPYYLLYMPLDLIC